MKKHYSILLFITLSCMGFSRQNIDKYTVFNIAADYNWIKYDENKLIFQGNSKQYFDYFFYETSKIYTSDNQQLKIVQFGDSHVQADFFGERFRENLKKVFPDNITIDRGFIFPYGAAKTNNPGNYSVACKGEWQVLKSTDKFCFDHIGIAGITIKTTDPKATIEIVLNPNKQTSFKASEIILFHSIDAFSATPYLICNKNIIYGNSNKEDGYTKFVIPSSIDTINIGFNFYSDNTFQDINVYGLSVGNTNRAISFSSLGLNGAIAGSPNRCSLFENQLNIISPDLIVLSYGTNDIFNNSNIELFENDYTTLLHTIRKIFPSIPIILTTPPDCMRDSTAINKTKLIVNSIYKIAADNNCAIWDFYAIMGGQNAIKLWYDAGLANKDKIHLFKKGYQLEADLFFKALYNSFIDYIETK